MARLSYRLHLAFIYLFATANAVPSKKAVVASLRAKWPQTSFLAETSEFISKEGNDFFWRYVDEIVDKVKFSEWNTYSDAKQHDIAVRLSSALLEEPRISLLKFALSLRAHSPVVQLFERLGFEKNASCPSFADVHGTVTCESDELRSLVDSVSGEQIPTVYSIDHVFPISKKENIKIIVYGELGTPSWLKMHLAAKSVARSGRAAYIFRHFIKDTNVDKTMLSGYGVELAIKSTEYKAVDDSTALTEKTQFEESGSDFSDNEDIYGFNFNVLRKLHGDSKEGIEQFRLHLLERDELTPLKVWQVQDLGYQAAQRIVLSPPDKALAVLTENSQNFPIAARSLSRQNVKKEFLEEVATNQELLADYGVSEGDTLLYINGISVDLEALDVFQILDTLKNEEKIASGFYRLGIKDEYLDALMEMEISDEPSSYAVDFRTASPEYLNNLDTDRQYRSWGNSVRMLLQPYFPGMLRPIARNFFTLIFVVDPVQNTTQTLLDYALTFHRHEMPLRLGFVFVINEDKELTAFEDASVAVLNFYNYMKSHLDIPKAVEHLIQIYNNMEDRDFLTPRDIMTYFQEVYPSEDVNEVFGSNKYNEGRDAGRQFLDTSGLHTAPKVLLNGVVLDESSVLLGRFEEVVMTEIMRITPILQKAVIKGKLKDKDNVMNWVMSQPEVMPRINKVVLETPTAPDALYLDLTSMHGCSKKAPSQFHKLPPREYNQCMMERMRYLTKTDDPQIHLTTVWIVTDLEEPQGRMFAYNAIRYLKRSRTMRVAIINNPKNVESASKPGSISMLVNTALRVLIPKPRKGFVTKLVKEEHVQKFLKQDVTIEDLAVSDMNLTSFLKESKQITNDEVVAGAKYANIVLGLEPGELAAVANGLLIGPINEVFDETDFELIDKLVSSRGAKVLGEYISKWDVSTAKSSDTLAKSMALLGSSGAKKRRSLKLSRDRYSIVKIPGNENNGIIKVMCVVDPLSRQAQRVGQLLEILRKVANLDLQIAMNPKAKLSELPLKTFYRLVLQPSAVFDDSGKIQEAAFEARFTALPSKQLLTMSLIPPDAWMVQSVHAIHDLDNIKMGDVGGNVIARYELEHILLEGHCFDDKTLNPPRGLQFTLGTEKNPIKYDTIVMANLGYFQLKAGPGAWILRLREGKSKDIYDIVSTYNTESEGDHEVNVLIDSFSGRVIRTRVAKKKGKEDEKLLDEGKSEGEGESIWSTLSSTLKTGEKYDTINVFSLASGHLYERFLRIMMLSVMKNTEHPVKFWLLKNYLSPQFKESLPIMAQHYGFQYELVEYRWPRWLHQQTEKQRIMWGYKILFLDVLFPLDVRKIIFVDADQTVRADLMELMELDLDGAPYGFTPFCDSRTSMEGFRFWKQGYWANHLAGRKYHISALYVIDLVKFRQVAAGDRLRGQYHGLSLDPNSLSNLDQDLPNNMIHQVRIKSLPQEWLWCETWCDDESKSKAKTIDLCNNPQTKEPKLNSAMRIVPEWKDYDAEIKSLIAGGLQNDVKKEDESEDKHTEL